MRKGTLFLCVIVAFISTSCGSKYNKIKFKDVNEGNTSIYGEIGGEPLTVIKPSKSDPTVAEISKEAAASFRTKIEEGLQK